MNKRDYTKFSTLMGLVPPKRAQLAAMTIACRNWCLLHPELARLQADEASLMVCRQYMHLEANRPDGPRAHIMDRLYKRFSNLRREMETRAMAVLLPAEEEQEAA